MTSCEYDQCPRPVYALGRCRGHYLQARRGEDLHELGERSYLDCRVVHCRRTVSPQRRDQLCRSHTFVAKAHHLSGDDLVRLLDGICASCGKEGKVEVDHDHACCNSIYSCGACVRGPLCRSCNTLVSLLEHGKPSVAVQRNLPMLTAYLDRPWFLPAS